MDIVHELIIRTTREKVYQALTEPEQIAAWYAPEVQAEPVVGSAAEFRFDRGVIRVQITVLEPNRTVGWKVLEGLRGWEGATGDITWRLTDNPYGAGTMLHYTHSGWQSMTGPYPSTNFRSGWYITRLQTYVESGVPRPA